MKTRWKFMRTGLKSNSGDHTWKVGEWYHEDTVDICHSGFHASKTPLQALGYVAGEVLAEVEVKGKSDTQDDKECWSDMRVVKAYHWRKADSVALSIFAAELVIENYETKYPNDNRPRNAIEAAKKVLADDTEENRSAAKSAAQSAEAAAWSAWSAWSAEAAAWSAWSAEAAAKSAKSAKSAAAAAAWAAAKSAAWAAEAQSAKSARRKLTASLDKWFLKRITTLEEIV